MGLQILFVSKQKEQIESGWNPLLLSLREEQNDLDHTSIINKRQMKYVPQV